MTTNAKTGEYSQPEFKLRPASSVTGQPGEGHGPIGTLFDGYVGGLSQPVNNDGVTTLVRVDVVTHSPDAWADAHFNADKTSPGYPDDNDD